MVQNKSKLRRKKGEESSVTGSRNSTNLKNKKTNDN